VSGDAAFYLRLVELLTGVGIAIASLEMLVHDEPLRDDGLLSWPVTRLRQPVFVSGRLAGLFDTLFAYPNVRTLLWLRLGLAVMLIAVPLGGRWQAAVTGVSALLLVGLILRSPNGLDGADQMANLTLFALTLAHVQPRPAVQSACLWFVAGQACLSYVTAGAYKLSAAGWRNGTYLVDVFATRMYGAQSVSVVLRRSPGLARVLAWGVIAFEVTFPLAFVLPLPASALILMSGLGFHLGSAIVMGLNTFLWSFGAAYPALVYTIWRANPFGGGAGL
jgi:hypothetical protein